MKLLIPEEPLVVLPTLACAVGLNEAVFLQQLHYWSARKKADDNGETWVFNTFAEWMAQMPWITSRKTFQRMVDRLASAGYIEVRQPNGSDRTYHYRLIYESLPQSQGADSDIGGDKLSHPSGQIAPFSNTTETTTEKEAGSSPSPTCSDEVRSVYEEHERLFGSRGKGLTKSKIRVITKALDEFDAPDLCKALRGLKLHREGPGKGRSTDLAAALSTNPNSGPLHEHIGFWIDYADKHETKPQRPESGEADLAQEPEWRRKEGLD